MKPALALLALLAALLLTPLAALIAADKDGVVTSGSGASQTDRHYSVRVDGVAAMVHPSALGCFCQIELSRPVAVEIECDEEIKTIDIRPRSRNIPAKHSGRIVRMMLNAPAKLSIEINGNIGTPLFLFADRPDSPVSPKAPGVRYFKAGRTYDAGHITLTNNQSVYIERGAVVEGWISAENASNVKILGHGILDATKYGCATSFTRCRNLEINGITTVKGSKGWVNKIFLCDQVAVTNYKVIAWGQFSDGIDLLGCRNVTVSDVFIRNEDDSIVLKTEKFGFKGNVENIVVQNCVIWHGAAGNALEIGYETMGDYIRNVLYKNIDIIRSDTHDPKNNRAALSIHSAGNATISNIRYENIRIEAALEYLINFKLVSVKKWGSGGGTVSDIVLKDIFLTGGPDAPSIIQGLPSSRLRRISIENLNYKGERIGNNAAAVRKNFVIENAEVSWR
jgi:hypothetical protein